MQMVFFIFSKIDLLFPLIYISIKNNNKMEETKEETKKSKATQTIMEFCDCCDIQITTDVYIIHWKRNVGKGKQLCWNCYFNDDKCFWISDTNVDNKFEDIVLKPSTIGKGGKLYDK